MGGSGGSYFSSDVEQVKRLLGTAEGELADAAFDGEVNSYLGELLTNFNDRDVEGIRKHLDQIRATIEAAHESEVDLLFGGSIAKHTYVDGISDVDALVFVDGTELANESPETIKQQLAQLLRNRFVDTDVSVGNLAITLKFADAEVQILPALRRGDKALISDASGSAWSEIDPRGFASELSKVNAERGNKVVPVIKLAKALMAEFPAQHQLTGYHAEALAIDVFKHYTERLTPRDMLIHFFSTGSERVMSPIVDSTGQSVHVDAYLGSAQSLQRQVVADAFRRTARRLKVASMSKKLGAWKEIFGDEP